ncbi:MAG: Mu transposase C-terminal domain-containing protein [Phyllobacterium sp.]
MHKLVSHVDGVERVTVQPEAGLHGIDIDSVPSQQWELARKRQAEIERLLSLGNYTEQHVREAATRLGCSRTGLYGMLKRYREQGTLTSLLGPRPRGGQGKGRIHPDIERLIQGILDELYLTHHKVRPFKVVREVIKCCRDRGLPPPSENTIRARIRALPARLVTKKREGGSIAQDKFAPTVGSFPEQRWPLNVVQFDHTKVDIQIVDEGKRQPIGRAFLTVAIDVKSRAILGMHLSLEAPSAASVGLCLVHAALPKTEWLRRRGVDAEWPMWGKPDVIHVDNGADFRSEALRRGCDQHGIGLEFRPLKRPGFGGIVERVIGMLMTEVQQLPGTTFSNVKARGNYNSEKAAILTLAELERILTIVITRQYHERPHSALHVSPRRAFEKGIYGDGETLGRGLPTRIENENRFLIDFLPLTKRSIQRYGFVWDYVHYYDDALRPFIDRADKRKFILRRDPRDISKVFFYCPDTETYIEIPYRNVGHPSITLSEHRALIARLKAEGAAHLDEEILFRAWEEVASVVNNATRATKHARRTAARRSEAMRSLAEVPSATPPAEPAKQNTTPREEVTNKIGADERYDDIDFW